MKSTLNIFLGILVVTSLFNSCKKDDDGNENHVHLTFNFAHKVTGQNVEFDSIQFTNAAGNPFSIEVLKYFVSDVMLHKTAGSAVMIDEEHYVDARDQSTTSWTLDEDIEAGDYDHIMFTFGFDSAKNKIGLFNNPPEITMEWPVPLGPGYHYMKMEGKYDSSGVIKNYNTHTGQSNGNPYFVTVTLPASDFVVSDKDLEVNIVMNIENWYQNPNLYDFNTFGSAMMANETAQQLLMENGADVFTLTSIEEK